jgi:hypothetical protein
MKRIAAVFVLAAALSGTTPLTATAAAPSGGKLVCSVTGVWPLTILNVPYCE